MLEKIKNSFKNSNSVEKNDQSPNPTPLAPKEALVFGCVLDGKGAARLIDMAECDCWQPANDGETLWLHIDRAIDGVDDWLTARFGICDATADLLTSDETRPRAFQEGSSLVTILRGVNLNEGAELEDLIALQFWVVPGRLITLRRRRLQTPRDVLANLQSGNGPHTTGDLFTELVEQLVIKMNRSIVAMNDHIDLLEEDDESNDETKLGEIADIRRNCLALKRYMSPQHDALVQIARNAPNWLSPDNRNDIRETIDRLQRYLEDLDVSKESAIVLQDEINNRAANEASRTMYLLSVVAAVFLPLSFLTGLLGINVGGIPGVDAPDAFWVTVVGLTALMFAQLYIFRKLKWL